MKGFTLIELLIAVAITLTITGAVFNLLDPTHGAFRVQPAMADVQQRLRASVDSLAGNLRLAGAGPQAGSASGSLANYVASVLPYRIGDGGDAADEVFFREDTVSVFFVPAAAAQTALTIATGGGPLPVAARDPCVAAARRALCGFARGDRLLVLDARGAWDAIRVTGVADAALQLDHDGVLSATYQAGATVTHLAMHTFYLAADDARRTYQLMHYDGGETDLPLVDDVVRLEFDYFGDPSPPARPSPPAIGVDGGFGWPPGENCVFAVVEGVHVPRLAPLGDEEVRLATDMLTDGPWCPNAVSSVRFDADLLRLRRVRVRLRVQAAAESLRARGALFLKPGTSAGGQRTVPDQEIRFDVAPRNLQPLR